MRRAYGMQRVRWHGCDGGARVEHLRASGDTHGWPSLEDANERIVAFLRSVPVGR